MSRAVLIYSLLVFLPATALSVFAFRTADGDYRERIEALDSSLAEEAEALARRMEAAMADASRKAESEGTLGFTADGRSIIYSNQPPSEDSREIGSGADELRYYRLSLRGGESYEYLREDSARALDAYAFYLPRIHSPLLRARLKLGMARAALASKDDADHRLGLQILRQLLSEGKDAFTEQGLPIDLLAAYRLLPCQAADTLLRTEARERLLNAEPRLSTPLLETLVCALAPSDAALSEAVKKRRALEAAVAVNPEILSSKEAILGPDFLLLAHVLPLANSGSAVRSIRLQRLDLPLLSAGDYIVRLLDSPRDAAGPGHASRPLRLGKGGPTLATLVVVDPLLDQKIAAISRQRELYRGLVGLLVLSTLAGGIALIRYVSKERQLSRLRSKLVANVSHELKSPVTSVRLFAEMLSDDRVEASKARRYVDHLRAESQRLSQLVENLLDLSRPANRDVALALEPVELVALLRRIAEGFSYHAQDQKVDFQTEGLLAAGCEEQVLVLSHPQALERIVLNLLDNALKYRGTEKPEVCLRLARDARWARISVIDNGPGIPRAEHERVFEEFYRVRYDDYGVKGSGLGLSISRRLARNLGGEVHIESREGVGSRFTLELPIGDHGVGRTDPHR